MNCALSFICFFGFLSAKQFKQTDFVQCALTKICQYLRIGIFLFAPIIYYILYYIGVVGSDIIRLDDKSALYLALGINCPNRKLVAVFVEKI